MECVGHAHKQLGSRLRNIVNSRKDTTNLSHGKNKLTKTVINSMQIHHGLAIHNNKYALYGTRKAIGPILFCCTEINHESSRHRFCPKTKDIW